MLTAVVLFLSMAACTSGETDSKQPDTNPGSSEAGAPPSSAVPEDQGAGTRKSPLKIGETATFDGMKSIVDTFKIELTATEVLRGDAAWNIIKAGNQFNAAPEAGKEYMLVKFTINALESEDDQKISINNYLFDFIDQGGKKYDDLTLVVGVEPSFSDMYTGATAEGYIYQLINEGDKPSIVFLERTNQGIWFATE